MTMALGRIKQHKLQKCTGQFMVSTRILFTQLPFSSSVFFLCFVNILFCNTHVSSKLIFKWRAKHSTEMLVCLFVCIGEECSHYTSE